MLRLRADWVGGGGVMSAQVAVAAVVPFGIKDAISVNSDCWI